MTRLVIVIVSYNARTYLDDCLRSLHAPAPRVDHEIIVVDNGSSDGSADAVRQMWPGVRLVEAGNNLGYAGANNLAVRDTTSELILLLNSDTVVPANAIDDLVAQIDTTPDVTAVGPRLVDDQGRPELSFGRMIGPFNELVQKVRVAALARGLPVLSPWVEGSLGVRAYPDWVSGACLLVRRADAEAVGLLDERFFLYGEDVDFCASLRARGHRILFTPEVTVVHHGGRSGTSSPAATHASYRQSQLAFYAKHHPAWLPVLRIYLRLRGKLPDPQSTFVRSLL